MAEQYRFQFPNDGAARLFVHLVTAKYKDVAMLRDGAWVLVIDGSGQAGPSLLELAIRLSEDAP